MRDKQKYWLFCVGVGAAIGVIFKLFEFVVNEGSDWLWNDVLKTNQHRWLAVPTALVLSLVFSLVLKWLKQPRWIDPNVGLFDGEKDKSKTTFRTIGSTLAQGASGLLAGGSLGPEMPLTEASKQIGKWSAAKLELDESSSGVLVLASIGALMVVFLGSLLLVILPFLLIVQQVKAQSSKVIRQALKSAFVPVVLTSVVAYITALVIHNLFDQKRVGYGAIPAVPHSQLNDYFAAAIVAVLVGAFAFALVKLIYMLGDATKRLNTRWPWLSVCVFGLVIGLLYLIGGQSVQFTGSEGSKLLLSNAANYSTWSLLGLALVKLAVTAWSKASGYRGGLFFPSIYASVAVGLFVASIWGSLSGPGVLVGAVAAIFTALLGSWLIAGLIVIALLPVKLWLLAVVAIAVTGPVNRQLRTWFPDVKKVKA